MGELSDRFASLMARMAKSDADLYRTIGAQNASVRQLVDDMAPPAWEEHSAVDALAPAPLSPAGLLPPEACDLKVLKARFGKLVEAQAWVESQIGPAPKKTTWALILQTCRDGAWPAPASSRRASAGAKEQTTSDLDQRLAALEQRLHQHLEERFQRLEALLSLCVTAMERPSGR